MSCLRFYFGKLCGTVDNFFCEKSCKVGGNVVILWAKGEIPITDLNHKTMSATFWITTISSIATALMAIGTFITIVITIKRNREALRARLIFAIVRKDDYVCLKVANVGNSVATNIHLIS